MRNCKKSYNRITLLYLIGILFVLFSVACGIMMGATILTPKELYTAITNGATDNATARIFWYVRLPRTLACLFCGSALAVSGAVIQGAPANPLATPSIIGVNSGAGLAVTLCTVFGIYGGLRLSLFSFLGAFFSVMLVCIISRKLGASRATVILLGVALNSILNAFSDVVVAFNRDVAVMSYDFKIGEFSSVTYQKLLPASIIITVTLFIVFTLTNELDLLTLGEENAMGLGLNSQFMRILLLILAALLAGCAVTLAGLLSFVGLIVPHIVRRLSGSGASYLLPLSALFGAGFVTFCDTLARTIFSPYEIPVGIIMSFLGAPFFVIILCKRKGRG